MMPLAGDKEAFSRVVIDKVNVGYDIYRITNDWWADQRNKLWQ